MPTTAQWRLVLASAACACALAAGAAAADSDIDYRASGLFGRARMDVYDDDHGRGSGTYAGWFGGVALEGWIGGMQTLHGAGGLHAGLDLLVALPGMIARDGESLFDVPDAPRLWLLGIEGSFGPSWSLYRKGRHSVAVGVDGFAGTERRGFALHSRLVLKSIVLAGVLRHGATWAGEQVFEQVWRLGWCKTTERRGVTREQSVGLQFTHGYAEDEHGRAGLRSFYKGGYTSVALVFSLGGGR